MLKTGSRLTRRSLLLASAGAAIAIRAPALLGQTKSKYAGTTIRGAGFSMPFHRYLKDYFPDFENKSGIKVEFDVQAFPVYNQRMDLELSTRGSAYDVAVLTFIYQDRWIGAGWVSDLDEFAKDPNVTPADWDPSDFVAQTTMQDAEGHTRGFGIEAGAVLFWAARADLLDKAGLELPTSFDEIIKVCESVNGKDGVAAWVEDNIHHWNWPPYLMGFGGNVFKNPPKDLTPTLDTPQAVQAAQFYADLLEKYAPSGVLSYTQDQALEAQLNGRGNLRSSSATWALPLAKSPDSRVAHTVRYGLFPTGPKGWFPGNAMTGICIPEGSRHKGAAWEFIRWALSKEMLTRIVKEHGYPSVCRRSVITGEAFKEALTLNGQDVAALYLKTLDRAGEADYMRYRTAAVFPQVGDKINRAISAIATGQIDATVAMKQAEAQAIEDITKAGFTVDR
jgi:multiple sugar transport system substrate-binding protein